LDGASGIVTLMARAPPPLVLTKFCLVTRSLPFFSHKPVVVESIVPPPHAGPPAQGSETSSNTFVAFPAGFSKRLTSFCPGFPPFSGWILQDHTPCHLFWLPLAHESPDTTFFLTSRPAILFSTKYPHLYFYTVWIIVSRIPVPLGRWSWEAGELSRCRVPLISNPFRPRIPPVPSGSHKERGT